jgi:hypothetical protein
VRPEFWSDPVVARLSPDAKLTYIGLWCVADDAGWLAFDLDAIGALLSPYESVRVRTRRLERSCEALVEAGRVVLHPCGCALIPKLTEHQRIGGNKSFTALERHRVHTSMDKSAVTLGNVEVGNGRRAPARNEEPTDFKERLAAHGLKRSSVS